MKRSTLFYIILILLVSCVNEINEKNDLKRMNLFGKVKSVKNFSIKVVEKNGEISKVSFENDTSVIYVDEHFVFDENGNIIEKGNYRNGKFHKKIYFKKDNKLNLIEKKTFNSDNEMVEKISYRYLYNNQGEKKEVEKFNSHGNLITKVNYKYSSTGKEVRGVNYNLIGQKIDAWSGKYDKLGNIIEYIKYFNSSDTIKRETFKYDNLGNRIEMKKYNSMGNLDSKWTYVYNKKGQEVQQNWYVENGILYNQTRIKYDNLGNQMEYISFDAIDKLESKNFYKYQIFDKNNNWTYLINYVENEPRFITERKIEYFE